MLINIREAKRLVVCMEHISDPNTTICVTCLSTVNMRLFELQIEKDEAEQLVSDISACLKNWPAP